MTCCWDFGPESVLVSITEDLSRLTVEKSQFQRFLNSFVEVVPETRLQWSLLDRLSEDMTVAAAQIVTLHHEGKLSADFAAC